MKASFPAGLAILALVIIPSTASAQRCEGRPGASAVEQYCEAIPSGSGDPVRPTDRPSGAGRSTSPSPDLAPNVDGRLRDAGRDGQTLISIVEAGETDSATASGANRSNGASAEGAASKPSAAAGVSAAREPSGGALRAVSASVRSGRTVGDRFLWVIGALTLFMVSVAWFQYRRQDSI